MLESVAPTDELRRWYDHDTERWEEFRKRYESELDGADEPIEELLELAVDDALTLCYAAKDRDHNNAVVLKGYLAERLARND